VTPDARGKRSPTEPSRAFSRIKTEPHRSRDIGKRASDWQGTLELVRTYADLPLGVTDASIIALADRHGIGAPGFGE